jgi:hypothetical protein
MKVFADRLARLREILREQLPIMQSSLGPAARREKLW